MDVSCRRPEREDSRAQDRSEAKLEAAKCREKSDRGEPEAGHADLELERTIRTPDEPRCRLPKENMKMKFYV
jgi:hypothetical protein